MRGKKKTLITYSFFALVLANCISAVEPAGVENQGEEQQTRRVGVVASPLHEVPMSELHRELTNMIIRDSEQSSPKVAVAA